jgi:hypothetical protein
MTLAIVLVIAAVLSLVFILRITVSRSLQVSGDSKLAGHLQPIDVEAFRNLVDPAEDDYLRRRLSPRQSQWKAAMSRSPQPRRVW